MNEVEKVLAAAGHRRSFIKNLGLASAAAGIVGSGSLLEAQTTTGPTDIDILNFALNLEYLEAEFYTFATSGLTIDYFEVAISGSGTAGKTTGGTQTSFTDTNVALMALELSSDERTHVSLLQGAITSLGGTPIAKPAINLAALGSFATQTQFLTLARAFEEIGVTAYAGAANLISNKSVLEYAARILAAEAEHVGYIRSLIVANNITVGALDKVDIVPPPAGNQFFSLNSSALAAIRTPGQVLALALGGVGATSGGFFPSGVNGNLNTAASATAVTDLVTFTLSPNPTIGQGAYVPMTITWNAPGVSRISIRLGSPAGNYFIYGGTSGSMMTPAWVQDGMVFYLQNATNLATEQTAASTLAIAIARVM
jgi:hypothetical protein